MELSQNINNVVVCSTCDQSQFMGMFEFDQYWKMSVCTQGKL